MCVGNTSPAVASGFPGLCLQDGPLGIRFADHITATPAGITVGATWNKDLFYKRGRLLGLEYRTKGVNVMLGPAVGALGKQPAGGRNWEGFGSDPVLQGWAGAQTVKGVQEEGVIATIKHFVANEQEVSNQPTSNLLELRTNDLLRSITANLSNGVCPTQSLQMLMIEHYTRCMPGRSL